MKPRADSLPLRIWHFIRRLSGDDAYERYLVHHDEAHPGEPALDRHTFYVREQERRFNSGPTRCC